MERTGSVLEDGYQLINMTTNTLELRDSFNNLARDQHSLSRYREVRLGQYFVYNEENCWICALLPQRKYIQSAKYIRLKEAGGVLRHRERLTIDPGAVFAEVADKMSLAKDENYQVNVNQIRVLVNSDYDGITVPEGFHRDGHMFSAISVVTRYNVDGGVTAVKKADTGEIVFSGILQENETIVIDDECYVHNATNITVSDASIGFGYRDIWVIEISRWSERQYGPRHEIVAAEDMLQAVAVD